MPRLVRLFPQHPTNLAYISSRLLGLPIVLKTSESIWLYPAFAFVCYVSIHLEISATVVRSAPEEFPIRIRTTSFRTCGIGQGSVAKTEEAEGMSESWRADWWLGTISLSQGCFQMSQVCGLWSDDGLHGNYPRLGHNFLFADHPPGTRTNGSSISALPC